MPTVEHTAAGQRLSRDDFYRLLDAGAFLDRRVELIGGEIVEMAAQKNLHAISRRITSF